MGSGQGLGVPGGGRGGRGGASPGGELYVGFSSTGIRFLLNQLYISSWADV